MKICLALKHRESRDSGVLERILQTEVKHRSGRELGFSSGEVQGRVTSVGGFMWNSDSCEIVHNIYTTHEEMIL